MRPRLDSLNLRVRVFTILDSATRLGLRGYLKLCKHLKFCDQGIYADNMALVEATWFSD